jgi:hypothetical protein
LSINIDLTTVITPRFATTVAEKSIVHITGSTLSAVELNVPVCSIDINQS